MARAFRIDNADLRPMTKDPTTGFLRGDAFVSKVGVFPYWRDGKIVRELRHPDDVFSPKSLASAELAPVTLGHPATPDGLLKSPQDAAGRIVGAVGGPTRETTRVRVPIVVHHTDAIMAVESGVHQISPGYTALLIQEAGVFEGQPYDERQTDITYNHFAILPRGRQGPDVGMRLDAADAFMLQDEAQSPVPEDTMKVVKVRLDAALEIDLPEEAAGPVKASLDKAQGRIEALESDLKKARTDAAVSPDAVASHLERVLQAKEIFGDEADVKKLVRCDAAELDKTMLKALAPDLDLEGKSRDFIAGAIEMKLSGRKQSKTDAKAADESLAALGKSTANATARTDAKDPVESAKSEADKAFDEMLKRRRSA